MPRDGKQTAPPLVALQVLNQLLEPLSLVWVPDDGQEMKEYAQVAPGEGMTQASAVGHRWQLQRADGIVMGEITTTSAAMQRLSVDDTGGGSNSAGGSSSSAAAPLVHEPWPASLTPTEVAATSGLVSLEVSNPGAVALLLVWRPEGGAEAVEYAELSPGAVLTQQSAVGHRWQLVSLDGRVVAEVLTTDAAVQHLHGNPPPAAEPEQQGSPPSLVALEVTNGTSVPLSLVWVPDGDAEPIEYAQLAPGGCLVQQSTVGHRWQLVRGGRDVVAQATASSPSKTGSVQRLGAPSDAESSHDEIREAESSYAEIREAEGSKARADSDVGDACAEPPQLRREVAEAFYSQEVEAGVADIRVRASACVSADALAAACRMVRGMLKDAPAAVLGRLAAARCTVAVIARDELTTAPNTARRVPTTQRSERWQIARGASAGRLPSR